MANETPVDGATQAESAGTREAQAEWRATLRAQLDQLDVRARELLTEGNRSRFVIQRGDSEIASVPLTAAAAVGAVGILVAPLGVAAVVAGAALARVNAKIER